MTQDASAEETLKRWQDEGRRCAPASLAAAWPRREQLAGLTGLQQMQLLLDGKAAGAAHLGDAGFRADRSGARSCHVSGASRRRACSNPLGTVHGGWYATLLDSAVGCAVHTAMPAGRAYRRWN